MIICYYLVEHLFAERVLDPARDEKLREDYREFFRQNASTESGNRLAYLEGRVHQCAGRHEEAEAKFREVVAKDRTVPEPRLRLAETLLESEGGASAGDFLRSALLAFQRTDLWDFWVALNLKDVLSGKAEDVALKPNDILFVPHSTTQDIAGRAVTAAIGVASGVAIWRLGYNYR